MGVVYDGDVYVCGGVVLIGYKEEGDEAQRVCPGIIDQLHPSDETMTVRWMEPDETATRDNPWLYSERLPVHNLLYPVLGRGDELEQRLYATGQSLQADGFGDYPLCAYRDGLATVGRQLWRRMTGQHDLYFRGVVICTSPREDFFADPRLAGLAANMLETKATCGHSSGWGQSQRRRRMLEFASSCCTGKAKLESQRRAGHGTCGACGLLRYLSMSVTRASHQTRRGVLRPKKRFLLGSDCAVKVSSLIDALAYINHHRRRGDIADYQAMVRVGEWAAQWQ
ncbi:MAG: hypothetical protein GY703_17355 [Gammaproteobacteria bacterium]|nr:hypothetical protein [Gammaproteobacteria bacterium]